jgi:hypothetical protein
MCPGDGAPGPCLVSAVELSTGKPIKGTQGRRGSNAHSSGFGDRIPIRWVIPMKLKNRPAGLSRGAVPGCLSGFLSRNLPGTGGRRLRVHGQAEMPVVSLAH